MSDELKLLRDQIDKVDKRIIKLLSDRFKLVRAVALYKKKNKIKTTQADREKEIINKLTDLTTSSSPIFIKKLYSLIFKESKRIQKKEHEKTI